LSYKVAVVGDLDTVVGFGLAGATHIHVHSRVDETLIKLKEFMGDPEIGLLLITHPVVEEMEAEFRKLMREKGLTPLVLRIPDKTGRVPEVDELREIIRRTVGAEIVIRRGAG
jgi:vacuolar-type H+-ATPase subunit F/Vma7